MRKEGFAALFAVQMVQSEQVFRWCRDEQDDAMLLESALALRAPLRALDGFSLALLEGDSDRLDGEAADSGSTACEAPRNAWCGSSTTS